jgi:hypothetical protein
MRKTAAVAGREHPAALSQSGRIAGLALLLSLSGCGGTPASLYPLEAGTTWRYRVTITQRDGPHEVRLEERSIGDVPCGQTRCTGVRAQDGQVHLLEARGAAGLRRVGVADAAGAVQLLDPPEWLLPEAAERWPVATRTALLVRRNDDYEEARFPMHLDVSLSYHVAARDVSIEVPAGSFSGCLKLEGTGHLEVQRNRVGQTSRVEVSQFDWYCPGAGLALRERTETTDNDFVANGSYRQALVSIARLSP